MDKDYTEYRHSNHKAVSVIYLSSDDLDHGRGEEKMEGKKIALIFMIWCME